VLVAAPTATCLPFVLLALPQSPGGTIRSAVALVLIVAGTAWSVGSLRHLSTCLSVVPQARRLVDTGPYRWVRHPLYLGELVAVAGFAVRGAHGTVMIMFFPVQDVWSADIAVARFI
jgi:protein-S-isoprenylcysteine O-methyltransferase Ste14